MNLYFNSSQKNFH